MMNLRLFKTIGPKALVFLSLWTALVGGIVLDRLVFARIAGDAPAQLNYKLISEAWDLIAKEYVRREAVQSQKLTYGAIGGMVNALGDTGHSAFLTPDMAHLEKHFLEGSFTGIGVELRIKDGHTVILAPIEGSPAQRAGLQSGDVIIKVGEKDVVGLPLEEIINDITGRSGTTVSLTVLSPKTGQARTVSLVRAEIIVHNVTWIRLPGSGLADIRIAGFSQGVTDELRKALAEIKKAGIKGAILDLRDNPGGVFKSTIAATSQFLRSGDVALVRDNNGVTMPVPVERGGLAPDLKLVVLVNGGTASAAEIMAGALQDAHRARLVGEKTFGTGTVLESFRLSDGSALLLAIAEWLTPDGRVIWHKGISPDVEVPLPAEIDPLYPARIKDMTMVQIRESEDKQLLRALELLSVPGTGA
jgi:carboxyl-terminal processing protease